MTDEKQKNGKLSQSIVIEHTDGEIQYLETVVDKLLHIIEKQKEVKISDAAKELNVTENKIEEWGNILESHKLIEMHYPSIGKPLLRKKGFKKELEETKKKETEKKKKERKHLKIKVSKKLILIPVIALVGILIIYTLIVNSQLLFSSVNMGNIGNFLTINQQNMFLVLFYLTILLSVIIIIFFVSMFLRRRKHSKKRVKFGTKILNNRKRLIK